MSTDRELENWSVAAIPLGEWDPPEFQRLQLRGEVFNHPGFRHGEFIRTSDIKQVDGSRVTTSGGSVYVLGTPDRLYVKWCRENGHHVPTQEEPLKLI